MSSFMDNIYWKITGVPRWAYPKALLAPKTHLSVFSGAVSHGLSQNRFAQMGY